MIIGIFANVGAGKSTLLAKYANSKKNKKKYDAIFSTAPIANSYEFKLQYLGKAYPYKLDPKTETYLPLKALILIEEAGIDMHNLKQLKDIEREFIKLHRHYLCDIIVVSQSQEDVNIVLRRLYEKVYLMDRTLIPHLSIIRQYQKRTFYDPEKYDLVDGYVKVGLFKLFFRYPYYKYFNSYNAPKLDMLELKEWDMNVRHSYLVIYLLKLKDKLLSIFK